MLATLASAAAAPPLAPPGAADAPTLDLYVGEERRTTLAATHATATDARLLRVGGVELSLRRRGALVRRAALAAGRLFQALYSSLAVVVDGVDRRRDEYREEHPAAAKRAVVFEAGLAHG